MKIDSAIQTFLEKYDKEAMESIEEASHQFGRVYRKDTIKLFNLTESINMFNQWLKGYAKFHIDEVGNRPTIEEITESCTRFLNGDDMFKETAVTFDKFPSFVKGYIESINKTIDTIDNIKSEMMEAGVDGETIGAVNTFADMFMDKLNESFDPAMDNLLWASGYNARKSLFGNKPKQKPVFL